METFIQNYRTVRPELVFIGITEPQAVAITQVWNALVGNWEADFREQDMKSMIGEYPLLYALYKTPIAERPIESHLMNYDNLKIGHMTGAEELQKDLGKGEKDSQP